MEVELDDHGGGAFSIFLRQVRAPGSGSGLVEG